jgi:NADH:ubiquinone oxidoreductase subunit F (NADH-binding)
MPLVHRVLSPHDIPSLDEYLTRRGGTGIDAARQVEPEALIDEVEAAGLRGRGGAGFPTHRKWRTIVENRSDFARATVVVNGAEGEPGTFKDRTIFRNNPYVVIEGALIAAKAVAADQIIFALKASFGREVARLRAAIDEVVAAGWTEGWDLPVQLFVFEGPDEYLYGEETALLEAIDGRVPFPRLAPPFRRGVRELGVDDGDRHDPRSGLSALVEMAGPSDESLAPPALVDNVETIANIPRIMSRGGRWFRTQGTDQSPGTVVCTVTGKTAREGVGEVMMGTTLREAIDLIGGGARPGRSIKAVMSGVSNALIPAELLDTPMTYEDMAAIGSGLGSAGLIVFDDNDDLVAVAAGASRFLAVESCGQCSPCKQDGLTIAGALERLCQNDAAASDVTLITKRLGTVANGARCFLATQQQVVVTSLVERFPDEIEAHVRRRAQVVEPSLIAELVDIDDEVAVLDERHRDKQPDWSYGADWSGQTPADLASDHQVDPALGRTRSR